MNETQSTETTLEKGIGIWPATALNISNMVGVGPFITIPAFIAAMEGPHAIIAWVLAAILVLCDGLVWSELGAAMPGSGGTYHFLKVIFGKSYWGNLIPFLFIWQFIVSGALELASGYVGIGMYLDYALPNLDQTIRSWGLAGGTRWVIVGMVFMVTLFLCQRVARIGILSIILCSGTLLTVLVVIGSGLANFDASLLVVPPDAFHLDKKFAVGLGGAMLIAIYDYFGYFNVCHLGEEVREPGKTIPRAVILSILIIAVLYLTMNISIMAVVPWQQAMNSKNIAADFMEQLFGRPYAVAISWMIVWTAIAALFAGTLAYSRIPFAAAKAGDFFAVFAKVHPRNRYPVVSLLVLGLFTACFCFLTLDQVVSAAVTIRILIQFIGQIVAQFILRTQRKDIVMPFRSWFYPIPSLVALFGWLFILGTAKWDILLISLGVMASGIAVYLTWKSEKLFKSPSS